MEANLPPKVASMRIIPQPKFKLPPEELEKARSHALQELDNLKSQVQKVTQERAEHEQRLNQLIGILNQLQGAIKELQAFALACGVDLVTEDEKRLAEKPTPPE